MKTLTKEPLNVIIGGVGGQGNVLMAFLVGSALLSKGYLAGVGDTYGTSQRGGPVASHVRISKEKQYSPLIASGHADVIVALEPVEALRLLNQFGNPDTVVITNSRPVYPPDVSSGKATYPEMDELSQAIRKFSAKAIIVNATDEALKMGGAIFTNVIMIGALIGADVLPLDRESMAAQLADRFHGTVLENDIKAVDKGIELVAG
ncbi:MAG: 2-oxoacid:acceptor oxidoreductase family protein [Dehalococcoidia bacterium]|nr:2-oxoacid:acceptor oxidoreductase family protein [Dehalococcoidia bacterium]